MRVKVLTTLLLIDCMLLVAYTSDFIFRCNGLYGQVKFDSEDDHRAIAKYRDAITGILPEDLSVVNAICCFFNDDFGLVFSSAVIETDYFWQCTHIPLGQQISGKPLGSYNDRKRENAQVIRNFFDDPTADIVYDKRQNNGLGKLFGTNAKWIWATINGSAPAYNSGDRYCVSCKGHTKNYVPREFFGWLSSASKEGLQLFGINYREFELAFELIPPSWNRSYCTGARVTMIISPGHSYLIAIFGAETDLVSELWHCASYEMDSNCIRLSEVSMYPLKCHVFNMVWIAIKRSGQFSLGIGRVPYRNAGVLVKLKSGYQTIQELRVDYASTKSEKDEKRVAKLRIFRSSEDNRCIFHEGELHLLQPCGDGYITDENHCHECGCCFYPAHLLGHRVTKDNPMCYRPMSSLDHSVDKASLPLCFRSFHDVIKDVSLVVSPSGKMKLFQNVTFVIAIQNMPTNVRVKLKFGDGLTEENIVLAKNAQIPSPMSFIYSNFYFATVVHQYTSQAPSGVHDCIPKSCSGYFATLEVVGRDEDHMEVVQFVEGGNAPFEAQIFTRTESKNHNVTICVVVSKLEVPITLVQAFLEFDGYTVNVSLKGNLTVPAWLSSHYEPDDYVVILNHIFNTKDLTTVKFHLLLPNSVRFTVESKLTELFRHHIGLYDVITNKDKKSSFNLYENITFLLRIQHNTDVIATLSFGDGKILQHVKLSRNISLEDIPEWAVPFTQNSSLCKTFVFHRYTNPGKYAVRLEFPDVPDSENYTLFNETLVHVRSFVKSLGKVALLTNTSVTINPYDTVTFIILVENIVGNAMAVLKLDEDTASLYARFTRSTKVEYEGVWYNAVTVTYSFYKPGRHNITLTIRDGHNSSNQAPSVAATEIMVNRIQDAIGEVGLYANPTQRNVVNAGVEFCVLVQRYFRHMRLHASMGDGHTVEFIRVSAEQQPPSWTQLVPPKLFYLKGIFSHTYSSVGTYLVEIVGEDSLKSRPDYSTSLIRVVVHDPLSDTVTVSADSDETSVPTTNDTGDGRSYSQQTDESQVSVSDFTDLSATTLLSSAHVALTTVVPGDETGLSEDTTELDYSLTTGFEQSTETDDATTGFEQSTETDDDATTGIEQSTETDDDAMRHSGSNSSIAGFAAAGLGEELMRAINDTAEQSDNDGDFSGLDFSASSVHQLSSSYWEGPATGNGYKSNFSVADFTVASSGQQYSVKETAASQQSSMEGDFSDTDVVVTLKNDLSASNESIIGKTETSRASVIDEAATLTGSDVIIEGSSDDGSQHYTAQETDDFGSSKQFPQSEIDKDETSALSRNVSTVHPIAATNVSQQDAIKKTITYENAGFPSALPESGKNPDKTTTTSQPNITTAPNVSYRSSSPVTSDDVGRFDSETGLYKTTINVLFRRSPRSEKETSSPDGKTISAAWTVAPKTLNRDITKFTKQLVSRISKTGTDGKTVSAAWTVAPKTLNRDIKKFTKQLVSKVSKKETDGKTVSAAWTVIKSNIPDKGFTPTEISTRELKQITSRFGKDTYLTETEGWNQDVTAFKSISHELVTERSTVTPKTLKRDITKFTRQLVSKISKKRTDFTIIHLTRPNILGLESVTSGSSEEISVDTTRKPFEVTTKDAEHKSISSPYVPYFFVAVYVDPSGIVNFLVLLENATNNLSGEILLGDNSGENFTFDQMSSDFPDWLLERPRKDGNFHQVIRSHVYPDNNITYEANVTVYDDSGNGFSKTVIFKPQHCNETESILKVNDKTGETCFQLYTKDSSFLNILLPLCLLTRSTRSKWTVSRIFTQGNDAESLVEDRFLSPIARDVLNYTILPFTLEAASYMIEAQVNFEDEYGTIVATIRTNACITLQPTHLQAVAFASKQLYTINETIIIDATSSQDPSSNSGLELSWFCSINNIGIDSNNGESKRSACFEDGRTVLGFSGTILTFPAMQLIFASLPANYFFTVTARKSGRESASATVQISLIVGDRPSCNISCLYNCKVNIDVYQLLVLQVSCSNCHRTEKLSYLWTFVSSDSSNQLAGVSSKEVLLEYNTARCAVKAGVFSMARFFEEYQVNVRVSRADGTYSSTSYPVIITTPLGIQNLFSVDTNFEYMKKQKDQEESASLGPMIAIIIGIVAGVIALAGTIYLVRRHLSHKARASRNEPPKPTTAPETTAPETTA